MPSLSSFALAFRTRSDCLLAYSGLRFPSSTYFMATSTSSCSFCAKDHAIIRRLATSGHAVSHYRYPHHPTMRGRRCCSALVRDLAQSDVSLRVTALVASLIGRLGQALSDYP